MSVVISQTPVNPEDALSQGPEREEAILSTIPREIYAVGGPAMHYYISFSFINHPPGLAPPGSQESSRARGLAVDYGAAEQAALISGGELSAALTEGQRLLHHHPFRKEARPPQQPGADGRAQQGCCSSKC